MDDAHKQKLIEGRKKYMEEHCGLVARIDDNLEIHVDDYQFILLEKASKNSSYFPSIDGITEELMKMRAKYLMLQKEEKTLVSVRQSIIESHLWMKEIVGPLLSVKPKGNHNDSEV
jgi:energy-converting hydrogenase A subunit M